MTNVNKTMSYIGLFFVVFVWGSAPLFTLQLYKFYSPTIRVCFSELVLVAAYLFMARKHLKEFDLSYLKIGISTGIFMTLANISQEKSQNLPQFSDVLFAYSVPLY